MTACLRLLLPLALVAGVIGFAPADDAKTLELYPRWKKGDALRYDLTRTQVRETDGKVTRKTSSWTPVEVEVLVHDDDGFVVRWTQGSAMFEDPKLDDDPFIRTTNAVLKGIDIDLEIDPDGGVVGMRNWKEVRGTGQKIRDAALMQLAKSGTPKDTVESIRKSTDAMFASKESVEESFGKQPAILFGPLGLVYEPGKATPYEDELPNPFGGEAFPTKGEYALKEIDRDAGVARVVFRQAPDPKQADRILRQVLDDMAKKAGTAAPENLPEFRMVDVYEYEVDLETGWVVSVVHTRTTQVDKTTEVEQLKITRREG